MDQNIQKALWLGISILFFVSVVGIGLMMFTSAKEVTDAGQNQINDTSEMLSKQKFTNYDAVEVTGAEVVSAIKTFETNAGEVLITVILKNGNTTTYLSSGSATSGTLTAKVRSDLTTDKKNMQDKSKTQFINQSGSFDAILLYDTNDNIRGIQFTQK